MRTGRQLAVMAVMLGATRVAYAEPPGDVLVLPTQVAGNVPDRAGWQREFDARLERAVAKASRASKPAGPLTAAEASCRAAECMGRLAESAGVQVVLGAHVSADHGTPPSYTITIDRYDRDRPDRVQQEKADCTVCTEVETADRLEQIATTLLPAVSTTPVPPVAIVGTPPTPAPSHSHRSLYLAIGGASVAAVAGVALIGVGARALVINDRGSTSQDPPPRLYDTTGTGIGLLVTGSILALGGAIAIPILIKRAQH